jgi:hypothetical protein
MSKVGRQSSRPSLPGSVQQSGDEAGDLSAPTRNEGVRSSSTSSWVVSPLERMSPKVRERRMCAVLEAAAVAGDTAAAREWLQHRRWRSEMRLGKPGTSTGNDQPTIFVVDTLGTLHDPTQPLARNQTRVRPAFGAARRADPRADGAGDD